jgi:hypothetical protein
MRDRSQPQAYQRPFPFNRLDLWDQFPETLRQQCKELTLRDKGEKGVNLPV